ncbi:2-oxoglutarate and iron-dependent oxygenase domain-containing protein [Streptomyces sp. SJ1-7]|nr:2-oxoglutarate and iron-dependent oxygenase domain-containing protein [Streptomyces sp. SJ1-7]
MDSAVPVVDLGGWRTASAAEREETAAALDRGLRDTGMFLLTGHGVPETAMQELRARGREFFALPSEAKRPYAIGAPYESGWLEMHPGGGWACPVRRARRRRHPPICTSPSTPAPPTGRGTRRSTGTATRPTAGRTVNSPGCAAPSRRTRITCGGWRRP